MFKLIATTLVATTITTAAFGFGVLVGVELNKQWAENAENTDVATTED